VTRTPLSRSKGQRSPGRFTHRGLNATGSCSGKRENVLGVGNYCYVAVCSAALGASAPTEGGEGRGITWRPPACILFKVHAELLTSTEPKIRLPLRQRQSPFPQFSRVCCTHNRGNTVNSKVQTTRYCREFQFHSRGNTIDTVTVSLFRAGGIINSIMGPDRLVIVCR